MLDAGGGWDRASPEKGELTEARKPKTFIKVIKIAINLNRKFALPRRSQGIFRSVKASVH